MRLTPAPTITDRQVIGAYGIPCLRAMSKFTASLMAVSLKVKSGGAFNATSPLIELLVGADDSFIIHGRSGGTTMMSTLKQNDPTPVDCMTTSVARIRDILIRSPEQAYVVAENALRICMEECKVKLDYCEFKSMVALVLKVASDVPSGRIFGLCVQVLGTYLPT